MKPLKTKRMIEKILKEESCIEIGVFISLLSFYFIKSYDISIKEFIKSLKNSLETLEKENEQ